MKKDLVEDWAVHQTEKRRKFIRSDQHAYLKHNSYSDLVRLYICLFLPTELLNARTLVDENEF